MSTYPAVFHALESAGLSPSNGTPGLISSLCPVCRGKGIEIHLGKMSNQCSCTAPDIIKELLKLADGVEDSVQRNALSACIYELKFGCSGKPKIVIGLSIEATLHAVDDVLANQEIYQRNGYLVDVVRSAIPSEDGIIRAEGTPRIRQTPKEYLRLVMQRAADWYRFVKDEKVEIQPPMPVSRDFMALGQWTRTRPLNGVIDYPVLRPDSTVMIYPGYDRATGLMLETSFLVDVPETPTREQAIEAVKTLVGLTVDFPFADDASRSAWMATLLTPLARPAIDGPVPLTVIDANTRGAGKTMLADLIGAIVFGRPIPRRSVPGDSEEWAKVMTAIGISADPVILLDNITSTLKSDVLDMVLTGESFRNRLLGKNEEIVSIIKTAFIATSNNARVSTDLVRRSLHIRLESPEENPEQRSEFQQPDLLADAKRDRPLLLNSAMTILRAYAAAGWPAVEMRPMGSYAAWSRTVRGALIWAGMVDPAKTQQSLRELSDEDTSDSETLVSALASEFSESFTAKQALKLAESRDDLREAIMAYSDSNGRLPTSKKLAGVFKRIRGRNLLGKTLDLSKARNTKNTSEWIITQ